MLKMLLIRTGKNPRVMINGDTRHSGLGSGSGLADAASRLAGLNGVYIHEFETADIVHSRLVRLRSITARYETRQAVAGYPATADPPGNSVQWQHGRQDRDTHPPARSGPPPTQQATRPAGRGARCPP